MPKLPKILNIATVCPEYHEVFNDIPRSCWNCNHFRFKGIGVPTSLKDMINEKGEEAARNVAQGGHGLITLALGARQGCNYVIKKLKRMSEK